MKTKPWRAMMTAADRSDERGLALITLLVTLMIVTMISLSLVGLMNTDVTHAAIQHAVARSFFIAQAGLEEAKLQVFASADPAAYATPEAGVTEPYGGGQFTYWVDPGAGPETACGVGLQTLEAVGRVTVLNRTVSTRVRACGVGGVPFLTSLFGASRIQLQGAATRLYLAPYQVGTPGGGGNLASFTEINFADTFVRVNALSDVGRDFISLRDGRVLDYMLFGFSTPPRYDPAPMNDPSPWILSAFGDIIKAQPASGPAPNPCGTAYACVTVGNRIADITRIGDLREANYARHVYMNRIRQETLPRLGLDAGAFRTQAARNTSNAALNKKLGFRQSDSVYSPQQFYDIVANLAADPAKSLQGTVYVEGSLPLTRSVSLGDITLAVGGDLVIADKTSITIRHDLTKLSGRRTPGIVVFGMPIPSGRPVEDCEGEQLTRSGRLVLCEGSTLTVDGLVYTQDGMAIHPGAFVDQVGAMYHDNRGTANPSFAAQDATVVLRFDPLALGAFGQGVAILSWQQLDARDLVTRPAVPPAAASSQPPAAVAPSAVPDLTAAVPGPAASKPAPVGSLAVLPPATPRTPSAPPVPAPQGLADGLRQVDPGTGPGHKPTVSTPPAVRASAQGAPPLTHTVAGLPAFHVQAGAFKSRAYAADLAGQLRTYGYSVALIEGSLIRVWVGPVMSRKEAEQYAARLRADGFEAVLRPTH